MRAGRKTGVARITDQLSGGDRQARINLGFFQSQMGINGHRAIIVQYPDTVGFSAICFIDAALIKIIIDFHDDTRSGCINRSADRHDNIYGILVLFVGMTEIAAESLGNLKRGFVGYRWKVAGCGMVMR